MRFEYSSSYYYLFIYLILDNVSVVIERNMLPEAGINKVQILLYFGGCVLLTVYLTYLTAGIIYEAICLSARS